MKKEQLLDKISILLKLNEKERSVMLDEINAANYLIRNVKTDADIKAYLLNWKGEWTRYMRKYALPHAAVLCNGLADKLDAYNN